MAHQPIHPDGGIHKVDFECRCGHCRDFVASECFWNFRLPLPDPHGEVNRQIQISRGKPMIDATIKITVPPEKRKEILQTFKAILGPIRREQGCISCNCYVDVEAENIIFFKEEWKSSEDLDTHLRSGHFGSSDRSNETAQQRAGHQVRHHCLHGGSGGDKGGAGM